MAWESGVCCAAFLIWPSSPFLATQGPRTHPVRKLAALYGYSCQQCVSFPRVNVCFSRFAKTSLLPCAAILSPPFFLCQLVDFCPVSACTITVTVVAVGSLSPRPRSLSCPRSMYGGELFDRLILRGAYTENEARQTFAQVAQGLLYLHGFVPVPPFAPARTCRLPCGPGTSM